MTADRISLSATSLLTVFAIQSLLPATGQAQPGQGGPGGGFGIDPRAENRTYHFEDTNEDMSYCVFVPSTVTPDDEAPLIITLHGMGATPDIMCNSTAVNLAEERGYILAAPMGYNPTGWYGSPVISFGAGPGRGAAPGPGRGTPPGAGAGRGAGMGAAPSFDAINSTEDDYLTLEEITAFFSNVPAGGGDFIAGVMQRWDADGDGSVTRQEFDDRPTFAGGGQGPGAGGRGAPGAGRGTPPGGGIFGGDDQPENLEELSEKDVMNVLAIMRNEFTIDEDRIYLTGHSMGGAGTYFLGSKHADIWAAIAPVAPAAFMMTGFREDILQPLADAEIPVMVVHGDVDEAVPVTLSRDEWVPTIEALGIEHEYIELEGVTHGPVIYDSQEFIYDFFDRHSK